jgi:hypothetical protein
MADGDKDFRSLLLGAMTPRTELIGGETLAAARDALARDGGKTLGELLVATRVIEPEGTLSARADKRGQFQKCTSRLHVARKSFS